MKILITGATGFIGRALLLRLQRDGHQIKAWVRDVARARDRLGPDVELVSGGDRLVAAVADVDAVVNLAGEPIADKAWTPSRRATLVASRVDTTRALVGAIAARPTPLPVLVSASAIGYYGMDNRDVDETSGPGTGFAADLCVQWENAARAAQPHVARLVVVRIGLVFGQGGAPLAKLLPVFRAGLGGTLGDGDQWVSWIHLDDLCEVLVTAVEEQAIRGVVNAVAPNPITNRELTEALGRALHRPTLVAVPGAALRLALGERAELVLGGQRVLPRALTEAGFSFRFASIDGALRDILVPPTIAIRAVRRRDVPDHPYLRARRPRHVLVMRTVVDAPLADVFAFFADAENLALITPRDMEFRIASALPIAMHEGTVIDYTVKVLGVPVRWRTTIERWQPGQAFVDSQSSGPYRSWFHEHRFVAAGTQTIMDDTVYFAAPLGLLGRAISQLVIAGELRRIFGHRAAAIRRRFGGRATVSPAAQATATAGHR